MSKLTLALLLVAFAVELSSKLRRDKLSRIQKV